MILQSVSKGCCKKKKKKKKKKGVRIFGQNFCVGCLSSAPFFNNLIMKLNSGTRETERKTQRYT